MSFINYHHYKQILETENAVREARLELAKALIELWQVVEADAHCYPQSQIDRLKALILNEVKNAWTPNAQITFGSDRLVAIADGPMKVLIEDLASVKDLNRAIGCGQ